MELARSTWAQIEQSRNVNYQLLEETITDINLLRIKTRHSNQIKTRAFSKPEEGKNGADWEWWFKDWSNSWVGIRMQAKILNIHSNEFEHLHYKNPKSNEYQSNKLIRNCLKNNIPRRPLYCLYLQTNDQNLLNTWNCGTFSIDRSLMGCSIIDAFDVVNLRPHQIKSLDDLEHYLRPWHCLVCCQGHGGKTPVERISNYINSTFTTRTIDFEESDLNFPDSFITNKPPAYVLNLLEHENNDNIKPPDEDLSGVILYSFNRELEE